MVYGIRNSKLVSDWLNDDYQYLKMKRRILVTTGTRAEYGILRPLLFELKNSKQIELLLVVTGMHLSRKHGYTIDEIKKDGFQINASFPMLPKDDTNQSMATELGKATISFSKSPIYILFKSILQLKKGVNSGFCQNSL